MKIHIIGNQVSRGVSGNQPQKATKTIVATFLKRGEEIKEERRRAEER